MNKKKLNIKLVQHLWLDLNQERIDQVLSLCIGYPWKQIDHMKKVFKEWKTWGDVWDKKVDEEGLTRTWPRWTIHRRRASGSLGIEKSYVMEKGKWIFNPRNQAYYEESISLSVNLYWIKKWSDLHTKSGNWSYDVKYSKSQPQRVNAQARSSMTTLMKSKIDEVARFNIVQAQVEGVDFIFNLEYRLPLYQEWYHMDCQQSLNTHIA
jgi:hypothetical protein